MQWKIGVPHNYLLNVLELQALQYVGGMQLIRFGYYSTQQQQTAVKNVMLGISQDKEPAEFFP